jgi:hypothetical protein
MADLPRIPAKNAVVIEPVEAQSYPDKYITGLGIQRMSNGKQPCAVSLHAYNFDTKELSPDPTHFDRLEIRDIWEEAARSTLFANVMGGLIQVVFLMYQENILRDEITWMVEGEDRDAKIVEFHAIQTQLGIDPLEEPPEPYTEQAVWAKPLEEENPEVPVEPPEGA